VLSGDYDVQADYRLLDWPAANGVQVFLNSWAADTAKGISAIRESQAWGEQYSSWIPNAFISQPATDTSGTLRIQRTGTTGTVSFFRNGAWIPVASGPTTTGAVTIGVGAQSTTERFIRGPVSVAWDNLRIEAGTFQCPTWWEDDSPDWQPLPG
jgi:hypothetical protein